MHKNTKQHIPVKLDWIWWFILGFFIKEIIDFLL
ncbi:hypothetical protein Phi39:1_gp29 [Cellulophaga phage phi39:1]|nr:hypothetical protein Phi39:1_gp29 [Cellulophaga phage phi39:1]AGO49144.1 hypothetical protein Phi39:1_gp29 [Cellulophaga phage phi39:1]